MNLGKLLSASTTIFGGSEPASYRLSKGGAMPKFNADRNPFGYKAAEPAPAPAPELAKAPAPVQKAPPPYAFKPAPAQVDSRPQAAAHPEATKPVAAKQSKQGWATRLNPFRPPEPPAAQSPRPVQSELSLNSVKVVHNDLADADVDVVPVKSHTNAVVEAPVLPPARRAWEYLGEHVLKS